MSSDNYVHKPMMSDLLCKQEKIRQMLNYYFFPMSFVNITQSFYPYITLFPQRGKTKSLPPMFVKIGSTLTNSSQL